MKLNEPTAVLLSVLGKTKQAESSKFLTRGETFGTVISLFGVK